MTLQAICKEIEKRIESLESQRAEITDRKIPYAKVCGNNKEWDNLLAKRNKIDYELGKLKDMRRIYKNM